MTPDSICFVINAKSHRVARHGSWLERALPAAPGVHILRIEDFAVLGQQIAELAQQGVTQFFVEGGDGTVLAVLSACAEHAAAFHTPPAFAILPGGSTNLAYKIVGFRARNARSFKNRITALLKDARPARTKQPALSVTFDDAPSPIIGFVFSTGTLARAMSYVQREFHGDGHRGSLAVAQAIFRFLKAPHKYLDRDGHPVLRGSHLSLKTETQTFKGPHCLSLATAFPRLSLGINPFWGQETGGISYTYAHWPMPHFRSGLLEALTWKRQQRLVQKGLHSHRADRIALHVDDQIMIDGEAFPPPAGGTISLTLTDPIEFLR